MRRPLAGFWFWPRRVRPSVGGVLQMLCRHRMVRCRRHGLYQPMIRLARVPMGPWSRLDHNWHIPAASGRCWSLGCVVQSRPTRTTGPTAAQGHVQDLSPATGHMALHPTGIHPSAIPASRLEAWEPDTSPRCPCLLLAPTAPMRNGLHLRAIQLQTWQRSRSTRWAAWHPEIRSRHSRRRLRHSVRTAPTPTPSRPGPLEVATHIHIPPDPGRWPMSSTGQPGDPAQRVDHVKTPAHTTRRQPVTSRHRF